MHDKAEFSKTINKALDAKKQESFVDGLRGKEY